MWAVCGGQPTVHPRAGQTGTMTWNMLTIQSSAQKWLSFLTIWCRFLVSHPFAVFFFPFSTLWQDVYHNRGRAHNPISTQCGQLPAAPGRQPVPALLAWPVSTAPEPLLQSGMCPTPSATQGSSPLVFCFTTASPCSPGIWCLWGRLPREQIYALWGKAICSPAGLPFLLALLSGPPIWSFSCMEFATSVSPSQAQSRASELVAAHAGFAGLACWRGEREGQWGLGWTRLSEVCRFFRLWLIRSWV